MESDKIRIMALHSGASNSNIFKFQLAQLRKQLGKDVTWIFLDAPFLWEINEKLRASLEGINPALSAYHGERPELEKKLAGNKPFRQWFKLDGVGGPDGENRKDYLKSTALFMEQVEKEQPIDVVISIAMPSMIVNGAMERFKKRKGGVPWQLTIFINPIAGLVDAEPLLPGPVVCVHSSAHGDLSIWKTLYSDLLVLEYADGMNVPTIQPRATEIYERLAFEVRKHTNRLIPSTLADTDSWKDGDLEKEVAEGEEATTITPSRLAELLRTRSCIVADTRPLVAMRAKPFPGTREDFSLIELKTMHPTEAKRKLAPFRRGLGSRVVAVSVNGDRCQEYCAMLVNQFGFRANRLYRLDGGIHSWDLWELEHHEASNEIRKVYGFPEISDCRDIPGVRVEELAELMRAGNCLIADVRELPEIRGKVFPGGQKDISLLTLQKKPAEAKKRLDKLLEDGKQVVAISVTGCRCQKYCTLLIDQFSFPSDKVSYLVGGLQSWDKWAAEHEDANDEIRMAHHLPASRGRMFVKRDGDDNGAAEREYSLSLLHF